MSGKQTLGWEKSEFVDKQKSLGLHTVFILTILRMFFFFFFSPLSWCYKLILHLCGEKC